MGERPEAAQEKHVVRLTRQRWFQGQREIDGSRPELCERARRSVSRYRPVQGEGETRRNSRAVVGGHVNQNPDPHNLLIVTGQSLSVLQTEPAGVTGQANQNLARTEPVGVTGQTEPVGVTGQTEPAGATGQTEPVGVTGQTEPVLQGRTCGC